MRPIRSSVFDCGVHLGLCIVLLLATAASHAAEEPSASALARETTLGLEEAIRLTLEKNFVIKVDTFEPSIARASLTEAFGRYDPQLKGSYQESRDKTPKLPDLLTGLRPAASVTKTNDASLTLEGLLPLGTFYQFGATTTNNRGTFNSFSDTYSTFAGVSVTQPLLRDFGLNPGLVQVRIARTNLAISEWEYRLTVTNVVTQVIYAYCDLHLAQAQLKSALRSREMARQLYRENEGRRQRGAMSEYDVLSARARVATLEDGVLRTERNLRVAENALKQLVSDERSPEFFNWHLAIEPLPVASAVTIDPAAGFRDALALRPDYQRARLGVKRSDLERRYQRNQLLPTVDLNGSYGYSGIGADFASSRTDARTQDHATYSAGVSLSVPLTSATERGRARAAALRLRQAETDLQRFEQDILVDVSDAAQQVETTRNRVVTTRTARELNEAMLEAEQKRLRAGSGTTFNVLFQQERLSSAEVSAALALADHRKALAEYDRQTGRTLETHRIVLNAEPAIGNKL